jgi:polysaccharide biosynthesis protein PslH
MKPRLLYLSPLAPSPTGSGLAMRAFQNLAALASPYDVTLLIMPTGLRSKAPAAEVRDLCTNVIILGVRPWRDIGLALRLLLLKLAGTFSRGRNRPFEFRSFSPRRLREAERLLAGRHFDVIHVFRLYLGPYALRLRRANPAARIQLDLDDFESRARREQGELSLKNGQRKPGIRWLQEAAAYERIERQWLDRFDRIFTCSELDRQKLREAYGPLPVEVLPNVSAPPARRSERAAARPFVFLFAGTFSYFPNADGLEFLCRRVMPLMASRKENPFVIHVIGAGVNRRLRLRCLFNPHIRFFGRVPSMEKFYDGAGAALVPVRTGGGTRIKIIEAIAHRLPVVSTTKGIEGLTLEPGVDALVGDTPEEMAEHCRVLMEHEDLRERLRANAFTVFNKKYTPQNLKPILGRQKI